MLLGDLDQWHRHGLASPARDGAPVNLEALIIDDSASLRHFILVGLQRLLVQRKQYMQRILVAVEGLLVDPNLEKVQASPDTGHIVLETKDVQSTPCQRLRKSRAARLDALARGTCDLEGHVVDCCHRLLLL